MTQAPLQRASLLALVLCANLWCAVESLPEEIRTAGLTIIDMVYREEFRSAEEEAKRMIRERGDHPAGYFFYAVVLDSWMAHYQSGEREEDFHRYCELAVAKGEAYLDRKPDDPWVKFFIGGADGYIGTYEARFGRWITAFRYGWKGVSRLTQIAEKHPEIRDVNYGIGTYEYWRSAMTKTLWFMPGVEDKREAGIQKLLDARANGLFTKTSSAIALVSILVNEKRYDEALAVTGDVLKRYPMCTVVHIAQAEALLKKGVRDRAEQAYRYILGRVEADARDNHFNGVLCHRALAQIYFDREQFVQCIAECNRMNHYRLSENVRKRLEREFTAAEDLRKKAEIRYLKSPERDLRK